jgi:hypothetical protein
MLHQIKLPKHLSKHLRVIATPRFFPIARYISSNFFPAVSKLQANNLEINLNQISRSKKFNFLPFNLIHSQEWILFNCDLYTYFTPTTDI